MLKKELYRAFFNKRMALIIILSLSLLYFSAYKNFLNSFYFIDKNADDLTPEALSDILEIGSNTYHIWYQSYSFLQMLFVLIAVYPFASSYVYEKNVGFHYLCIIRCGHFNYRFKKLLATGIAGGMALFIPSLVYLGAISLFFNNQILSKFEFQPSGLFSNIFIQSPFSYIMIVLIMHFVLGFSIAIFAMGVTSFSSKIILVYVIPFALYLTFDILLSNISGLDKFTLTSMYYLMSSEEVKFANFLIVNAILILVGALTFYFNYKWELKYG